MTRRSPIERICENCIYRVTHRKKRKPEVPPSQILTFNYTSHLADIRWLRERARRRHE
ncbi:NinE family protein [Atlantibacter hermannii]|uniref:NinE family protein n=1 Tax=Atlantibacter hermannii TaxID=565 RepID=UPI0028A8F2DE|nr:NinE family protein [Atlantibacter hermannii]